MKDRRVVHATALAAVCDFVNQYSLPLRTRTPFLEQGVATRLARLLRLPCAELRLSAMGTIIELAYSVAEFRAAGIKSTLKHLVEPGACT
jgi:hypothetical protein